jgi:topoisomerase-4 subunit A
VTKYSIKRVELKEEGVSTLKPRKIWFDDTVQRLNVDDRGELLGEFKGEDRLLIINQKGIAKTIIPEVTARFDEDMIVLEKWLPNKPVSAIYYNAEKELFYVKRFLIENPEKEEAFIPDTEGTYLELVTTDYLPVIEMIHLKPRGKDQPENEELQLAEFIAVKGINAQGNMLTKSKIKQINLLASIPYVEETPVPVEQLSSSSVDVSKPMATPNSIKDAGEDPELDDTGQASLF